MTRIDEKVPVRRTREIAPAVVVEKPAAESPPTSTEAPVVPPGGSSRPVGGAAGAGSKTGAQMFLTRGATGIPAPVETPRVAEKPAQSRSFLTKVVIELTKARDRLRDEMNITPAEWARVSKPERQTTFTFSFRRDDGTTTETTGFRTVFSTIRGPGKGGLRVTAELDQDTVNALSSEMPAKTAIMNASVGGAKGGFVADPKKLTDGDFARGMRGWVAGVMDEGWKARRLALGPHIDVPAPDVGTSHPRVDLMAVACDQYIGWLLDHGVEKVGNLPVPPALAKVKRDDVGIETPLVDAYIAMFDRGEIPNLGLLATFTGKSVAKGGSLGRAEATGLGVALSTLEVMKHAGLAKESATTLAGTTVAVQGYGNVGRGAVLAYADLGAKVTDIAEFDGQPFAIHKEGGFTRADVAALDAFRAEHGTIRGFPGTQERTLDQFWSAGVDVLSPCAREGVITDDVAQRIRAKVVAEGANGPTTHEGDAVLQRRGIVVSPDVFANAAGVTVSCYEMEQNLKGERWTLEQVLTRLHADIPAAFARLAAMQAKHGGTLRSAAYDVALADFVTALRAQG